MPVKWLAWRRCENRLNAIFDLAKRWQRTKAARRAWGPWWNVLRAGFGKGLKLHGRVWGPGGTCFGQVLKPSKCRISICQGSGKG